MQAFMQSLQMRWPVAAHIGLSIATIPSAPMVWPPASTRFISEIFSSSGHPASTTPNALFLNSPLFSLSPFAQESGAPLRGRQLEHRHAVHNLGLNRNEIVRVDFARQLEQDAAFVPALALRRVGCPGSVARGKIECGGMLGPGLHPGVDPPRGGQISD